MRARAVGLGRREPDSQVVPALVARLDDEDPVVRLAANEELRQRHGPRLRLRAVGQPRGARRRDRPMAVVAVGTAHARRLDPVARSCRRSCR